MYKNQEDLVNAFISALVNDDQLTLDYYSKPRKYGRKFNSKKPEKWQE